MAPVRSRKPDPARALRAGYWSPPAWQLGLARRRTLLAMAIRRLLWRIQVDSAPALKRALDVVGASLIILASIPIFLAVALAIKLEDGGPVFFRQVRVGKDGRRFQMCKFRSMTPNAEALKAEFSVLDADLKASLAAIPAAHRRILTSHDAFGYFAHAYGVEFVGLQGSSTEGEPTAQDLKRVIEQIKAGKIHAVFLENMSDPRFVETLASDTGAKVGGELYADALSDRDGPAADLLSLFRHNQSELLKVLK